MVQIINETGVGGNLGKAIGGGFSEGVLPGLKHAINQRANRLKNQQGEEKQAQRDQAVQKRFKDEPYKYEAYKNLSPELQDQVFKEEVIKNPEFLQELLTPEPIVSQNETTFDILQEALQKGTGEAEKVGGFLGMIPEGLREKSTGKVFYDEPGYKKIGRSFKNKPITEEAITASVENLNTGGIDSLSVADIQALPKEAVAGLSKKDQRKYRNKKADANQHVLQEAVAGMTPFIGKSAAKGVEKLTGVIPRAGEGVKTTGRLALEMVVLGGLKQAGAAGEKLLGFMPKRMVAEMALFGGGAAVDETLNAAMTGEPIDKWRIAIDASLPIVAELLHILPKRAQKILKNSSPDTVAEQFVKAEKAGIDLENVVAHDAQSVKEWRNLTNDLTETEARIERTAMEAKPGQEKAAERIAEDRRQYAKRTRRVNEEMAEEAGRVAEKEKPKTKRKETVAKENALKNEALEKLPESQKKALEARKTLNETKDKIRAAQSKGDVKEVERLRKEGAHLRELDREAAENLKAAKYQAKSGKPYRKMDDLERQAFNDIANSTEKLQSESVAEVLERTENKLDKLAKEVEGRRTIPGQEQIGEDTFERIYKTRISAAEQRLKDVEKNLKESGSLWGADYVEELNKEREFLKKLIKREKGRLGLHRRRKGLQSMKKTLDYDQWLKKNVKIRPGESWNGFFEALDVPKGSTKAEVKEAVNKAVKEAVKESTKAEAKEATSEAIKGSVKESAQAGGKKYGLPNLGKILSDYIAKKNKSGNTLNSRTINIILSQLGISTTGGSAYGLTKVPQVRRKSQYKNATPSQRTKLVDKWKRDGLSQRKINEIRKAI